jgi:hypothetical protein
MGRLRASDPSGPLAVTHRTGKRKNSPGTGRRYDSVWVSSHWVVRNIEHLYAEGIKAGSDHAPVVVYLDLTARSKKEEETDQVCVCKAGGIKGLPQESQPRLPLK